MSAYETRKLDFEVGAFHGRLRVLKDRMQFSDPAGEAADAGICSASWSLFGQLWPASTVLAKVVKGMELGNRRVLELGCGLALPSLTLKYRGVDITASDYHPESETLLRYNSRLNALPDIPFFQLDWNQPPHDRQYDLIIASDVLYEPAHPGLLSRAIAALAGPVAKVLLTCPGRGHKNRFSRKMARLGFELTETPLPFEAGEQAPFKGRLLSYQRGIMQGAWA